MRAALLTVAVLALAGCGATTTVTVTNTVTHVRTVTVTTPATTTTAQAATAACHGDQLAGKFVGVEGSAGAGQIVYRLTLTNTGSAACYVSGLPQVQLLGTTGGALPTSVSAAQPGTGTGAKISLQPGDSATAEAQFSPDVPGTGDSTSPGQCEPTATVLRVTATGGGTLDAPIQPPTPVCERGSLHFKNYGSS
ncbi:MAG TPA: DUF4232 domain-containing protein [Gaiellaceae bacterium]